MLNILSLLLAVGQRCTSYLNPPNMKSMTVSSFNSYSKNSVLSDFDRENPFKYLI